MRLRALPRTLRGRLVLAAVGAIVAAVSLFAVTSVLLVDHELGRSLDRSLRAHAQDVAQLAVSAPAVLTQPGALESPVSGRQTAVEVVDRDGRILARSLTLGARFLPQDRLFRQALLLGRAGFENIHLGRRPFRLYAAPIAEAGGPAAGGVVLVASDTTDVARTAGRIGVLLTLSGVAAALLAALAAAALTGRGLRPLRRLASGAAEIERTADPTARLPERRIADELGGLTGVLNRMLASLERARENERRLLADASHELRTPVAALLGNVEYLVRYGSAAGVLADLERDAARLARLVDDLLALERAGAVAQAEASVDLGEVVQEAVRNHQRADGRLRLAALEEVRVRGDRDALARVLQNLIDNALLHGPAGGQVTVSLLRRGERALLTVSDEGPGPDPRDRHHLFERFWRGADARPCPGSGLGLSIVAAIAERHGGNVSVEGSAFTLELPAD